MRISSWKIFAFITTLLVLIPLLVIFLSWLEPEWGIWSHLWETVLGDLLTNTFFMVTGVAVGTLVLGVSLAWFTAVCDFPGRRFFSWALLLPLAMPTYVLAFVCLGIFDFSGPVQTELRSWFGTSSWFPEVRSTGGVILVMTLALYPYVYFLVRSAFLTQGKRMLEVGESLGCGHFRAFFKIVLPMARPWIAGGVMLVIMETLADFGAVSIFNFDTFTTAIYKAWFGFFSLPAASQLASCLVVLVFIILVIEQKMQSRMRFSERSISPKKERVHLKASTGWVVCAYASSVLLVAFILPVLQLLTWTMDVFHEEFSARYFSLLGHSLFLGICAALIVGAIALILAYTLRHHEDSFTLAMVRISNLGYALPGTVLAVGIFIPVAMVDNFIIYSAKSLFGINIGQIFQGTVFIMLVAYTVRFMAAGFKSIDSAMHRVTPSINEVSNLMGLSGLKLLRRVHIPMLRTGMLTAMTLVFVDVMKEMPITLMTRPYGWDTLAVKIFELTSEGEWERASLPALTLLIAGLVPIIILTRYTEK